MSKSKIAGVTTSLLVTTALLSAPAQAGELSGNLGATSNYLWRGLEQTNGDAAVFGGLDYADDSGFYMGTWVSQADWAPGMNFEWDIYGGYAGALTEAVSYDVGFIYFAYPDEDSGDADFSEVYGNLSFSGFTLGVAVLADGTGGDFGDSLYVSADYEFEVYQDISMALHAGSYSGDWLADDSVDYGFSLSTKGFTLGVSDTDIDNDDVKVYLSYTYDFAL